MTRWNAFRQLLLARLREFFREPVVLFWVYGFPLLLALGLGVAFSQGDPEPPPIDLVTDGPSQRPDLAESLRTAGLRVEEHPLEVCRHRLRTGKSSLYVEKDGSQLRCIHDPTRTDSRLALHQTEAALLDRMLSQGEPRPKPIAVTEPGSRYIDFLIPGLMGMNLLSGGLFGVGYALVDLRVRKLLKRLLATPMHRADFLAALVVSRTLLVLPEMAVLLGFATLVFDVPLRGSLLTVGMILLVSALTFDGMGLLIASRSDRPETVGGFINLIMMPQWLLSGTFFSSQRYPDWLQPFIQALPLTQVNDSLREVILEGATLSQVAWRLGILALWGVTSFLVALKIFRWQ